VLDWPAPRHPRWVSKWRQLALAYSGPCFWSCEPWYFPVVETSDSVFSLFCWAFLQRVFVPWRTRLGAGAGCREFANPLVCGFKWIWKLARDCGGVRGV
jgi:hypothetical protein